MAPKSLTRPCKSWTTYSKFCLTSSQLCPLLLTTKLDFWCLTNAVDVFERSKGESHRLTSGSCKHSSCLLLSSQQQHLMTCKRIARLSSLSGVGGYFLSCPPDLWNRDMRNNLSFNRLLLWGLNVHSPVENRKFMRKNWQLFNIFFPVLDIFYVI